MARRLTPHIWISKTEASAKQSGIPGYITHNIPLLTVGPPQTQPAPPRRDDTLIFTSQNGVKAFCSLTNRRDWSVYTVGDSTAKCAEKHGFKKVVSAKGDVDALGSLLIRTHQPTNARFYYASAQDVSGDLVAVLQSKNFPVERAIIYETHALSRVPEDMAKLIAEGARLIVMLYSAKAAQIFAGLGMHTERIETISISPQVDKNLDGLTIGSRYIAEKPTHASMIKQLH